ncbi:MAG: 3-deoxy-7-phosphoheptulonate synthase [Bacillota bacterium]|nr:3-deoxy-7-phosphoheptulonate synthase [Bacillota bacterium]
MSYEKIQQIPSAEEIVDLIPLSEEIKKIKKLRDEEIKNIFTGKDDRLALIIGPCSADHEDSVCEYISKLASIQEKVKDKILIIPRIYTNKPRTTGEGYKGMLHQPDPTKGANMLEGIKAIRKMHIKAVSISGLTCADEMLYPENYLYLRDILSYVAVGARSVEDQQHRLTVSGMDVPAGMKNPTSGDLTVMLNSIKAAQLGHTFMFNGWEVNTTGNPLAHAVLRGAVNDYGRNLPNYHYEDLIYLVNEYKERDLENPAVIIDTNHANSMKKYYEQPRIALEVMRNRKYSDSLKSIIKGFMIESYLLEGSQKTNGCDFGRSITDPCLGFEASEKLIYDLADLV